MKNTSLQAQWNYPTQIIVGPNAISKAALACFDLGITSPLLVTDPGINALSMTDNLLADCKQRKLRINVFCDIQTNPSKDNIEAGVKAYLNEAHDGVIAFGGGSALDAAKTIALMVGQNGDLWDYEDKGDNWSKVNPTNVAPIIAIPTTAGTGSEVGRASLITDPQAQLKRVIFHPNMLPSIVFLDPTLCQSLPPALTASTGMDALSHNLEAYCAKGYHPMADGIAMQGIEIIKTHLPRAYHNGKNIESRTQMLVASTMGATAFQKGLGAMHALSHAIGGIYQSHHGRLNAIIMPYVLKANQTVIQSKITSLARYLGLESTFEAFLQWILRLRTELKIEHRLIDIGIGTERLSLIASNAVKDGAASTNPIPFDQNAYYRIALAAINGTLEEL